MQFLSYGVCHVSGEYFYHFRAARSSALRKVKKSPLKVLRKEERRQSVSATLIQGESLLSLPLPISQSILSIAQSVEDEL